jgi:hypothetical protein
LLCGGRRSTLHVAAGTCGSCASPARRFAISEGKAPWEKRSRLLSLPPILLTTVFPVIAAVAIFIGVAVWWNSGSKPARSYALFDACVQALGYDATQPSFGATLDEQRASNKCNDKLPPAAAALQGGNVPGSGAAGFEQCMKSLGQPVRSSRRGFRGGFGGVGGGIAGGLVGGGFRRPSKAYQDALQTCRSIQASSSGGGRPTPLTGTTTTTHTTTSEVSPVA